MSGRVVRASEAGAALDAHLVHGGGADDTDALQGILDSARDHPGLHVVVDGPASVRGLRVHCGTTIEFEPGAGLYLRDGSRRPLLGNGTPSRDGIVDRDIRILGGFFNGNREGQTNRRDDGTFNRDDRGAFQRVLEFFGVANLAIEGATVWNARAFAVWIANAEFVTIRDTVVDVNLPEYPGGAPAADQRAYWDEHRSNLDGIHITGPARNVLLERLRLRTEDDAIALLSNEGIGADISDEDTMGPYLGSGPISDVVVRDVVLDGAMFGIRLLSANRSIDRVLIENVSGNIRHRMVVVSSFGSRHGGDFGSIEFRNVNVDPLPSATYPEIVPDWIGVEDRGLASVVDEDAVLPMFSLNGAIRRFAIDGLSARVIDGRPLVRLGARAEIGELEVRARLGDPDGLASVLVTEPGSRVERLVLAVSTTR
jgi:hypothetical protein